MTEEALRLQVAEEPALERLRAEVAATTARLRSATAAVQAAQWAPRAKPPSAAALQEAASQASALPLGLEHVEALHARLAAADTWVARMTDAAPNDASFTKSATQLEVCALCLSQV